MKSATDAVQMHIQIKIMLWNNDEIIMKLSKNVIKKMCCWSLERQSLNNCLPAFLTTVSWFPSADVVNARCSTLPLASKQPFQWQVLWRSSNLTS